MLIPFKKITLDNGLRVILVPQPQSLAATVLVLVEAGSKYETKDINGLSHFLEHMCFKGTKKRPKPIDIAEELAAIGAQSNAFTSLEQTGYYAKAEASHLPKIFDVISDIYLHTVFNPEEINKERGVIIEEINMILDTPMRYIGHLWMELLYGDQPAGWDVIGRKEIIQKLTKENFLKYRSEHYLPQATVVVVSGKFDEEKIMEDVQNTFGSIKIAAKSAKVKTREQQTKPSILLKTKATDQTHLILGVRAFDIFNERKYALGVLADILVGGMSSRLFQRIREEMGAAYYVRGGGDLYTDHGYLEVSCGVDQGKIEAVIEAILEEFKKIAEGSVSDKELQKSKEHLVGSMMLSLETSDALADFYGDQEIILKAMLTPEELSKEIKAVTAEEIGMVAHDIFKNEGLNLAVLGPLKDKEKFEKILTLS